MTPGSPSALLNCITEGDTASDLGTIGLDFAAWTGRGSLGDGGGCADRGAYRYRCTIYYPVMNFRSVHALSLLSS
jgi:hypothetical protein